ncbi:MAG: helix-turn-helix transcriptional regulator, partial [Candidatus Heimdallarchaeota archaeon]|nr:helix-turn-helix transcriptional regulator [Candidatus Heimdallarchaeota archaeon]
MNSTDMDNESNKYLKVLSNPIRQRILNLVSEQGSISFTNIKEELSLTDGSLFYHLKSLSEILEKDSQNFYKLSEQGKIVIDTLIHKVAIPETVEEKKEWFIDKITFPDLFYFFFGDPSRSLIELNVLLLITAWLFGVSSSYFSSVESILTGGAIINGIISFVHWYLYLFIIIISLKIMKIEYKFKELWIGVFVGIIPYFVYLIPTGILHYTDTVTDNWIGIILSVVFVICKI